MMTPGQYAAAKAILSDSGLGEGDEQDYRGATRPFRGYALIARPPHAEAAALCARYAELAITVGAYLTMNVHADYCHLQISISRSIPEGPAS